ncbi:MAG: hypothetical protein J5552_12210 [Prevotella sp.]|nr:hypothetical protein [Prevotella sp.]
MNHSAHLLRTRRLLAVAFFFLFPFCGQVGAQNLLFNYAKAHENDTLEGFQSNVYIKNHLMTHQRNFTLWCVPSMYAIARGQRSFVSEQYGRLSINSAGEIENQRQVYYTTIPHNRRTMPTLIEYITPRLYSSTLYGDHILSPFNHSNKVFYRYTETPIDSMRTRVSFRPRYVNNTQLVSGHATIDANTGRILEAEMNGEFDMMRFHSHTVQGNEEGSRALLPQFCETKADFKFLGNHISAAFEAAYDCPITLPDTVNVKGDRQLIDSLRPYDLWPEELAIYQLRDSLRASRQHPDTISIDTIIAPPKEKKRNYWKEFGETLGESLVQRIRFSNEDGWVRLSPIINPQYISYSHRKGLSYRFKLGARYNFTDDVAVGMNARLGYNFKQKRFYFDLPFRLDYDYRGRDAFAELVWSNGNRIYNSSVVDELQRTQGNLPNIDDMKLDQFDDLNMRLQNTLPLNNRLAVEVGMVFHRRKAVAKSQMAAMGMPTDYKSLAPNLSFKVRPWHKGPLFTIDYERGLPGKKFDVSYERWELDASMKHKMRRLQILNLRAGAGFYTKRDKNYFMDYTNFRDENLPEGWNDDWSGNFQLLRSRVYNQSKYYLRGNVSFESPLMAASFVPFVGRYVESERAYISTLSIAHTRLYSELGYGFTCRFFSIGCFASFYNTSFIESGAKFTFELFRRW